VTRRFRLRSRNESAMITIELLYLVPFVIVPLLVFAVYCGRVGMMSLEVERAARESARAASQRLEKAEAKDIAKVTILDTLGATQAQRCLGWSAGELGDDIVNVEGVGEQPDDILDQGVVTVTLQCRLDLSVFGPLVTSTRSFKTVAVESVDEYRSRASNE
jgi:hypothetical protein